MKSIEEKNTPLSRVGSLTILQLMGLLAVLGVVISLGLHWWVG